MKRENKLTKSLAGMKNDSELDTYLDKIGEKSFSDDEKQRWKVQTVLLYKSDAAPLKALKRGIEDALDVDVATSKLFRALLYSADLKRVIEAYKAIK